MSIRIGLDEEDSFEDVNSCKLKLLKPIIHERIILGYIKKKFGY